MADPGHPARPGLDEGHPVRPGMGEGRPAPGLDEIVLSAPGTGDLCNTLLCRRSGRPAQMIVTFGELGTRYPDALWPECWHRSYPMCAQCWRITREAAETCRAALVIQDARPSARDPRPRGIGDQAPARSGGGPGAPGRAGRD